MCSYWSMLHRSYSVVSSTGGAAFPPAGCWASFYTTAPLADAETAAEVRLKRALWCAIRANMKIFKEVLYVDYCTGTYYVVWCTYEHDSGAYENYSMSATCVRMIRARKI